MKLWLVDWIQGVILNGQDSLIQDWAVRGEAGLATQDVDSPADDVGVVVSSLLHPGWPDQPAVAQGVDV